MLKTFSQLLGDDVIILHRYLAMAVVYAGCMMNWCLTYIILKWRN